MTLTSLPFCGQPQQKILREREAARKRIESAGMHFVDRVDEFATSPNDHGWWWDRCMARVLILGLLLMQASLAAAAPGEQDIDVTVRKDGRLIDVDVALRVNATGEEAWRVLTDYNNMVRFVSSLESSTIVRQEGTELEVAQKGTVHFALLSFPFESVRRIELEPVHEIRSYLIEGDMKSSRFTTRIVDEGGTTLILQRGQIVPSIWVPPWIGPAIIAAGTRRQWQEIRTEILRRKTVERPALGSATGPVAGIHATCATRVALDSPITRSPSACRPARCTPSSRPRAPFLCGPPMHRISRD
jgi:hypothetical protein